jgi:dTDP-4-amino-4,6-dideoxygalactose transaminase
MTVARRVEIAAPFFTEEDRARIHAGVDQILSGALSMGPNVKAFEQEFGRRSAVKHAVAVNACTSALEIALAALGLEPGDEVIVPPLTFIATGMAVHLAGGKPVFAELSEDTLCLDFKDVEQRVTPRTRGVILVYFAGLMPPGLDAFIRYCRERGLFVIEDAAHAPGARRGGRAAGSWGDAGCFSFYPTKVITAGEGGMLTTNDDAIGAAAHSMQHRGRDLAAAQEQYTLPGRNVRMTELTALVGRVQLARLDEYLAARRAVVAHYASALAGHQHGCLVLADEPEASSYWKLPLLLEPGRDRDAVAAKLREAGVQSDQGYSPLMHLQPVMRRLYGAGEGSLPRSEALHSRLLCLPCHPLVAPEDVERAVEALTA